MSLVPQFQWDSISDFIYLPFIELRVFDVPNIPDQGK